MKLSSQTFNIMSVGGIFAADMSFVFGLVSVYTSQVKDLSKAFHWGTYVLALFSLVVVPILYVILRKIDALTDHQGLDPAQPSSNDRKDLKSHRSSKASR